MSDPNPALPDIAQLSTDLETLRANLRLNNGEVTTALALLLGLSQRIAEKLNDPELINSVNSVKAFIKGAGIAGREPPGCILPTFDNLPAELRGVLGEGWRTFFDQ